MLLLKNKYNYVFMLFDSSICTGLYALCYISNVVYCSAVM